MAQECDQWARSFIATAIFEFIRTLDGRQASVLLDVGDSVECGSGAAWVSRQREKRSALLFVFGLAVHVRDISASMNVIGVR